MNNIWVLSTNFNTKHSFNNLSGCYPPDYALGMLLSARLVTALSSELDELLSESLSQCIRRSLAQLSEEYFNGQRNG